jgi:N6-adenosine-specific RNA methylase IME4
VQRLGAPERGGPSSVQEEGGLAGPKLKTLPFHQIVTEGTMGKTKTFKTILLDPPWPEYGGGRIKRGADRHYRLLKLHEIARVVLGSGLFLPAKNAHLYLWVTNNYMPAGIELIKELGFRYITMLTWAKPSFGMGRYFRGQTEHVLFGVRGDGIGLRHGWTDMKTFSTLIAADRVRASNGKNVHSAKPEAFYTMVERASPPPRLEMFARRTRQGWESWGDEV